MLDCRLRRKLQQSEKPHCSVRSSLRSISSRRRKIRERLLAQAMITNQIRNARKRAPASTSGRGLNWQRTPLVRSCLGEWQEALSLPHPRAEPPLVAQTPSGDLFIGAKDLFGAAIMVLQKPSSLLIEHDGLIRFEERPLDHRLRQSVFAAAQLNQIGRQRD